MSPEWQRRTINTSVIHPLASLLSSMQSKAKKILSPKRKFISDFTGHCIFRPQTLKNRMEALLSQAKQRGHRMHTLSGTSITLVYLPPLSLDLTKEIPPLFSTDGAWDDLSSLKYIYDAHSNSFLKVLVCILVIHVRKIGPSWKPVWCLDSLCKSKGTKHYTNSHLDHETNWWFNSVSWQAIVNFSYFILLCTPQKV